MVLYTSASVAGVSWLLPPLSLLATPLNSQLQPLLVPSASQRQLLPGSVSVPDLRDTSSVLDLLLPFPTPVHLTGPSLTECGVSSVAEICGGVGDGRSDGGDARSGGDGDGNDGDSSDNDDGSGGDGVGVDMAAFCRALRQIAERIEWTVMSLPAPVSSRRYCKCNISGRCLRCVCARTSSRCSRCLPGHSGNCHNRGPNLAMAHY